LLLSGVTRPRLLLSLALVGCSSGASLSSSEPAALEVEGSRVRVLGIAQDGGLPHAACTCDRCEAARRDPGRASPVASLAIITADHTWLIDASPNLPAQLDALADVRSAPTAAVDRRPIDGVLLTHAHMGHYLGLAWLGYEAVAAEQVDVWASASMAEFLRTHAPWEQLVRQRNIVVHEASGEQTIVLDAQARVEATPFVVPHRAEYTDTFGWRVAGPGATVVYVPDTDPWAKWSRPIDEVLAGVDLLLIDGTFHSATELPGRDVAAIGHPLIVDTMDRLQAKVDSGELEVWFVHLNHSNPVLDPAAPERLELERRGFRVARVGDEFPL
jgi:pyrroloquinoline quinone biosynthesis protein B